jgi:hypothetical protein
VGEDAVGDTVGVAVTLTVTVLVTGHRPPLVAVTVYTVVEVGLTLIVLVVNPPGLQL